MKKGLLAIVMAGILTCMGVKMIGTYSVSAAEAPRECVQTGRSVWVNPLYEISVVDAGQDETPAEEVEATGAATYSSKKAAASYLRRRMVARDESISFYYSGTGLNKETLEALQNELLELALDVTASPWEGDYLRYHLSYISHVYTYSWEGTDSYIVWNLSYISETEEEKRTAAAIKSAVKALKLTQDSDAVKIKKIHDAICERVVYYDDGDRKVHSAYSAIEEGRAVCQGYATLFYAMGLEAGLKVRCVQGTGNGGAHLWNIVKLGNRWYNMDVTWDDQTDGIRYTYYMKNTAEFGAHVRAPQYQCSSFLAEHPMATASYTGKVETPVLKSVTSAGATSLRLTWSGVPTASGYSIYSAASRNGTYKKLCNVKGGVTSKQISGLTPGRTYYFKLCAYSTVLGEVSSGYSQIKSAKPLPDKVKLTGVSASKGAVRATWKRVSGAAGYQITVTYKDKGKNIKKSVFVRSNGKSGQSGKITGLKSGKRCSVCVRAYAKGVKGKVYGNYSSVAKKTVK